MPRTPAVGGFASLSDLPRRFDRSRATARATVTLGYRLAAVVSPADAQNRAVVAQLCAAMQAEVEGTLTAAFADQGYTGAEPRASAAQ